MLIDSGAEVSVLPATNVRKQQHQEVTMVHVVRFADETGQSIGDQLDHFDSDHCGHHQEIATFVEYVFGEL